MARNERRSRSTRDERAATSNDRARKERALVSAARWLKRRGAARKSRETRRTYAEAASVILARVRR